MRSTPGFWSTPKVAPRTTPVPGFRFPGQTWRQRNQNQAFTPGSAQQSRGPRLGQLEAVPETPRKICYRCGRPGHWIKCHHHPIEIFNRITIYKSAQGKCGRAPNSRYD
jgi:hypothetical protein